MQVMGYRCQRGWGTEVKRKKMREMQERRWMGVQVKVQEEVGGAAGWGKSALSGEAERVGRRAQCIVEGGIACRPV